MKLDVTQSHLAKKLEFALADFPNLPVLNGKAVPLPRLPVPVWKPDWSDLPVVVRLKLTLDHVVFLEHGELGANFLVVTKIAEVAS